MVTVIAIIAVIAILSSFRLSVHVRTQDKEESLAHPRGLGGYVADTDLDKVFPLSYRSPIEYDDEKLNAHLPAPTPTRIEVQETIDFLSGMRAAVEYDKARKVKPLRSDERYDEPQATYPMEMKIYEH